MALKSTSMTDRQVATPQKRHMPVWIKIFPWVVIVFAGVSAVASLMLEVPATDPVIAQKEHIAIATEVLFSIIGFGGGVLFLAGLHGFKFKLKVAYVLIAIGAFLYGVGEINVPVLTLVEQIGLNSIYGQYGGVLWPGLLSAFSFLIGTHIFGRLIGAKKVSLMVIGLFFVLALAAVIVLHNANVSILTHMKGPAAQGANDITNVLMCLYATIMSISALKILQIKRAAGPAYTNALAWFAIACGAQAIATWITIISLSAGLVHTAFFTTNAFAGAYVFSSFLIMKAGYTFTKITNV